MPRFFTVFCYPIAARTIAILILACGCVQLTYAQQETQAIGAIDTKTFELLMQSQELAEDGQYDAAIIILDTIKHSDKLNSYAKSQMWNFYAFIYASQDKYKEAINAYKNILAEADAPAGLKLTAQYTVAQLYFQLADYPAVIQFMNAWLREIEQPTATAYIMLAQAHYQIKAYAAALTNLNKAIGIEKINGKPIPENWLRMLAAIYFAKHDIENTLKAYAALFHAYPKAAYLQQISGLYGELGQERKQLTTYDAIYLHGGLNDESSVLNLAYMYLGQDIPYKAGKIIATGIEQNIISYSSEHLSVLANAWAQAHEHKKAIPALAQAAKLSDQGILYARLARVYFDTGDFAKAAAAAKQADDKGGLKRSGENHILRGVALFNIQQYAKALQAFRQAKQVKNTFSAARKWEQYTLLELKHLQALADSKLKLAEKTKASIQADTNNMEAMGRN